MADHDGYTIKALSPDTWDAFADLAERHNGVWNGCWCTWFITTYAEKDHTADGNRALKKRRVEEGTNHAALVFDGDRAVAWCEYGTPEEPRTSTTERSTRRGSLAFPTTASPASSSTRATAARASPASPSAAPST